MRDSTAATDEERTSTQTATKVRMQSDWKTEQSSQKIHLLLQISAIVSNKQVLKTYLKESRPIYGVVRHDCVTLGELVSTERIFKRKTK